MTFIEQFGILILIVAVISLLVKLIKQPIIIGYVISGLVFLYLSDKSYIIREDVIMLSEIGIAFMLFLMGLEFDFKGLKHIGKDILITTIQQTLAFFSSAFAISLFAGFSIKESTYISLVFCFSSTLLVAKWVEDKRETQSFHGKIIMTTLIVQDILAIAALTALAAFDHGIDSSIILIPFKGLMLAGIAFVFSRYILDVLLKFSSKYPELLFVISISTCFLFGLIAPLLGYSSTIGAFIGGIVLANTIYRVEIAARLKPLIVFFNMLFFVGLGFQLSGHYSMRMLYLIISLMLLGLILKPIIIYLTLRKKGYEQKSSFLSGLYLAQFSEFGIIIVAQGAGKVSGQVGAIAILIVILSMLISSYYIKYGSLIYSHAKVLLLKLDKKADAQKAPPHEGWDYNVIFFGYLDLSKELINRMTHLSKKVVVIENDPEKIRMVRKDGWNCIYNSVNNPDFFHNIDFSKVELVVSNHTDRDENLMIISELKKANPNATAIVAAKSLKESMDLYNANADHVIFTSYLNNQQVSVLLEEYSNDIGSVISKKISEIARLKAIQEKRDEASKGSAIFDIDLFLKRISAAGMNGRNTVGKVFRYRRQFQEAAPLPDEK